MAKRNHIHTGDCYRCPKYFGDGEGFHTYVTGDYSEATAKKIARTTCGPDGSIEIFGGVKQFPRGNSATGLKHYAHGAGSAPNTTPAYALTEEASTFVEVRW
jgi:hypothetical protein